MPTSTQTLLGTYVADPTHSSFQFAVRHIAATYRATFDRVEAVLVADGQSVRLEGRAQVDSISIKQPNFRAHVVDGDEFFDSRNHPEISFLSNQVDLRDDGSAAVAGLLTMRGVTREIEVVGHYQPPIETPFGALQAGLGLRARIDRRHWGMGWQQALPGGGNLLGWDVELTVELELQRDEAK